MTGYADLAVEFQRSSLVAAQPEKRHVQGCEPRRPVIKSAWFQPHGLELHSSIMTMTAISISYVAEQLGPDIIDTEMHPTKFL